MPNSGLCTYDKHNSLYSRLENNHNHLFHLTFNHLKATRRTEYKYNNSNTEGNKIYYTIKQQKCCQRQWEIMFGSKSEGRQQPQPENASSSKVSPFCNTRHKLLACHRRIVVKLFLKGKLLQTHSSLIRRRGSENLVQLHFLAVSTFLTWKENSCMHSSTPHISVGRRKGKV